MVHIKKKAKKSKKETSVSTLLCVPSAPEAGDTLTDLSSPMSHQPQLPAATFLSSKSSEITCEAGVHLNFKQGCPSSCR